MGEFIITNHCGMRKNITGNANNVVTANQAGSWSANMISVVQYSGLDTVNPLDTTNYKTGVSGTSITSDTFTTSSPDELIIMFAAQTAGEVTFTAGSGYTLRNNDTTTFTTFQEKNCIYHTI